MLTAESIALGAQSKHRRRSGAKDMGWHLDRHVNLSVLFAVFAQTVVIAYSFGGLYNRVERVEATLTLVPSQENRITRLEERLVSIDSRLQEIKQLVSASSQSQQIRGTKR